MGRKQDIEEEIERDEDIDEEDEELTNERKSLTLKKKESKEEEPQVSIITENQLINFKLDSIITKLDEVLKLAK